MAWSKDSQGRWWVIVGSAPTTFIYLENDGSHLSILQEREDEKDVYWVGDIKNFDRPKRITGPFQKLDEAKTAYLMLIAPGGADASINI
jgi:hypothetical protein